NFAQNSTTLLKDQGRSVRVTTGKHQTARSLSELEFQQNRAFTVTKPTSTRSFLSFLSFDFGPINHLRNHN
ncbi:MAG TPA: hypothetical protein PKE58_19380, partial [Acidobacteriota bacterium]|nr:hypothetical protein [Acidobacteriota bacterium]